METTLNNTTMVFNDSKKALDYLVNQVWDKLTLEQRKILRDAKREYNHGNISTQKIDELVKNFGQIEKKITIIL